MLDVAQTKAKDKPAQKTLLERTHQFAMWLVASELLFAAVLGYSIGFMVSQPEPPFGATTTLILAVGMISALVVTFLVILSRRRVKMIEREIDERDEVIHSKILLLGGENSGKAQFETSNELEKKARGLDINEVAASGLKRLES